jgi:hypothetical protein
MVAGMKTTWVLNKEQRKIREKSRKKIKNPPPHQAVFKKHAPACPLRQMEVLSDEDISEVNQYVFTSGFFNISKVRDMEIGLIRELIRYSC